MLSAEELRAELARASPPMFVDCRDLRARRASLFGVALAMNCFDRTDGDAPRFWTFSFTPDDHVAHVELEE